MKTRLLLLAGLFSTLAFGQTIELEQFATGFSSPVEMVNAGDSRLFVVQQGGMIRILNADGSINPNPFLNISGIINAGGEQGLLGLAFHPDYATNGFFYVYYTNTSGDNVVARYSVDAGNPDLSSGTGTVLITMDQPQSNHNGGCLRFGPDGYLYISKGDGGGANDTQNRAQNKELLLGKLLRIDVDGAAPYTSPATNPYVGIAGADEIWAYGLRNPWKFSFNRLNDDLWIADVGQNAIEEINKVDPTAAGLNFGWRCYEGSEEFDMSQCTQGMDVVVPFAEYTHAQGRCSITGGYVYTGDTYPSLQNKYFFADYCSGEVGTISTVDDGTVTFIDPDLGNITTFGEDADGELYVAAEGVIYKIIDSTPAGVTNYNSSMFAVYPNPASDVVNIHNKQGNYASQVAVYDLSGKLLINKALDDVDTNSIDAANLPSGLYMMAVTDSHGSKYNYKLSIK